MNYTANKVSLEGFPKLLQRGANAYPANEWLVNNQ